ncbi:alpha/beta hydrolase family protein [Echinimonas agarilytica]|uniref:Prolyl oligopeptidase family serine peptidase n=1 Tax=Echinimonas agarilytica TaxID=1215918 RepID=A0AA41W6U7_9GAMM|nr:alpha/beta fold hydrolase [Echinimonas agarilytica]MCM2680045.1 prolyl oligopeptidase family serine peptidase [Echinimonas agarilytica]
MKPYILFWFAMLAVFSVDSAHMKASDFFAEPDMVMAQMSPNGKLIAAIRNYNGAHKLVMIDSHSGAQHDLLDVAELTDNEASLQGFSWLDDQHVAVQFVVLKKGVQNLLNTKVARYMLVVKVPAKASQEIIVYRVKTAGQLVAPQAHQTDQFLYGKSGHVSKVYKIQPSQLNVLGKKTSKLTKRDGGQFKRANEVASVKGFATRWFSNTEGYPSAVLHFTERDVIALSTIDDEGTATELTQWKLNEFDEDTPRILPVANADSPTRFYCLDFSEHSKRSVYRVDFESGEQELLHQIDSFEILDLLVNPDDQKLFGILVLENGMPRVEYLNATKNGKRSALGQIDSVISKGANELTLKYQSSHEQPGRFYVVNKTGNNTRQIGSWFPHLDKKLKAKVIESELLVEGLNIPYLLTLPTKNKTSALVVLPHGGPIGVFDRATFDPITQFLSAQGYAVLRVNFRGSSGYSDELQDAGTLQWGKLMLTDIEQVTRKVIEREDILSSQVCVMGMSYGGYAAMMLALEYPTLFNCAVSIAGVSDINLHINQTGRTQQQNDWLKTHVGDSHKDFYDLKQRSPVYLADKLQVPLLIVHGDEDSTVDVEHAWRMRLMLEKHNRPFEWHIEEGADHQLEEIDQQIAVFEKTRLFLDKNMMK